MNIKDYFVIHATTNDPLRSIQIEPPQRIDAGCFAADTRYEILEKRIATLEAKIKLVALYIPDDINLEELL